MSKSIKKIASVALPIAGTFLAPGIGTALGSTLSSAALAGIGGAIGGAGGGVISGGGLKGALLGAGLGGAGGYISGGGSIPGIGSIGGRLGAGGMGPPTPGTGILGSLSKGASGLNKALSGAGSGGGLSLGNAGTVLSGINSYMTQDDLEEQLLQAQGRSEAALQPFYNSGLNANNQLSERLSAGFNPGDLQNDPGYQFRLAEGEKGLTRALSAAGMRESGAAVKAGMEFNQGLADQEYNDAFGRWNSQNQQLAGQSGQGYLAAGGMGDIYTDQGNIGANADVARNNILAGTLSKVLSGSGAKRILYIDANGKPVYDMEEAGA